MQSKVEELAGQAGLQILRAILENEAGAPGGSSPSAESERWLCALGEAAGLRGFCRKEDSAGTPAGTNARGARSGAGELPSVAARRKAATSGAGRRGGRVVHAELRASGGQYFGRLRDREEHCEPTVCGGQ